MLLASPNSHVASSAQKFVRQHADPADLAEEIRQGLRSSEPAVRVENLRRLSEIAERFPDLLDLLRSALADPKQKVGQAACNALRCLRWPAGIAAVPFLRKLMSNRDVDVRVAAVGNLEFNRGHLYELLSNLLTRLGKDRSAKVKRAILGVLSDPTYGQPSNDPTLRSSEVLAAVRAALLDRMAEVRQAALMTLTRLWHPLPGDVLQDLLELARTDQDEVGNRAIYWLVTREDRPAGLLEVLRERLRRYPQRWEDETFAALDKLGYTPTLDELPLLLQGIQEQNTGFAYSAARMLARLGEPAVAGLIPFLGDDQPRQLRTCVATALGAIGPAARQALPDLARMIASQDHYEARAAVTAIAAIGEPAEVVEVLRPAFRHRVGVVRSAVLEVAANLGPAARPWLEELLHLSRTDGGTEAVLIALARDEPALRDRIADLLHEPDPARSTARAALAGLE